MEGKVVIMSALLVSLVVVLGQFQVEAQYCCETQTANGIYQKCVATQKPRPFCAALAGCRLLRDYEICVVNDILKNTVNELPVEAKVSYTMEDAAVFKPCCPNLTASTSFNMCRMAPWACASRYGCILIPGGQRCPPGYPYNMLENTVNEYCKSGCVSSVCGAITTLQNSDASEVVKGAVEKCSNACSTFCTKGSVIQLPKQA